MEKVTDFFKHLAERLTSPLFSSYIIAWLVINWKIPIGLIFYKTQDLDADKYKSFIDLIEKNKTDNKFYWLPLCIALLYTFAYPFFRNVILVFLAWTKAWGSRWNLYASRTGKVSVLKYIQLKTEYDKLTTDLQDTLKKESTFKTENESLKNEKKSLVQAKEETSKKLNSWETSNFVSILNGKWERNIDTNIAGQKDKMIIRIADSVIYNNYDTSARQTKASQRIVDFHFNPNSTSMSFVVMGFDAPANGDFNLYILEVFGDLERLEGTENKKKAVSFIKIKE